MTRPTGLRQATPQQRAMAAYYRAAKDLPDAVSGLSATVQQEIRRILDQDGLPACVGFTMAAGGEVVLGAGQASGTRIWTDARLRDGSLHDPEQGTWFSSAIQSVMRRGFDPDEPGEMDRIEEQTQPDDLDSEMIAHDQRQTNAQHWRIANGDLDAVADALARGMCVGIGAGVRTPYFNFFASARKPSEPDVILTSAALGGNSNGHEQRIVSVEIVGGKHRWGIQNSWGLAGGCHLPDGTFQLGCALVDDSVLLGAWDIDAILITKRTA
jgi:hypothetical protein